VRATTKGKPYKTKQKPKSIVPTSQEWNSNTVTSGFFGNLKEIRTTRPLEELKAASNSGQKVLRVTQEARGPGKFYVDFMNEKGQKTGSLQMHKDLMSLNEEMENRQLQGLKYSTKSVIDKKRSKSRSQSRSKSRPKQRSLSRQERETNLSVGAIYSTKGSDKKHQDDLRAIETQVKNNFKEKESIIKMLMKEVNEERERKKNLDKEFNNIKMRYEEELKSLKRQTQQRARSRPTDKDLEASSQSLDMIPTRDKPIPKNKPHQVKVHKPLPYKSTFGKPISHTTKYKNVKSKLKGQMAMPESFKQKKFEEAQKILIEKEKEKVTPQKPKKQNSISISPPKSASKSPRRSADPQKSLKGLVKKSTLAGTTIKLLQEHEIRRQVQLEKEQELAIEVLSRFHQNPNLEMHKLQRELERVGQKLDPVMEMVDQRLGDVGIVPRLKDQANTLGMISRIAGRYVSFYSDELAEMLLDDMLEDTVYEMQHIENQTKKTYLNEQQQIIAQEMMSMLVDFDNETEITMKKTKELLKVVSKKKQKVKPFGMKGVRGVRFEIDNQDLDEIHDSKEMFAKGYTNPFTSAIDRVLDEDEYEDDFHEDSKEEKKKPSKDATITPSKNRYRRNLEPGRNELIEYEGKNLSDEREYKFRVKIPPYMVENIEKYRKEFEKFLIIHNNTSNKEVWKIYDHVTNDIFSEVFAEV
jgi:hypothetical protein